MNIKRLDFLSIKRGEGIKTIELFQGDITDVPKDQDFDTLIVSAFQNDYFPTQRSVIGALARKGVSVEYLSEDKAQDIRHTHRCWLSKPFRSEEVNYNQIICFEAESKLGVTREPLPFSVVVGDIFKSLIAFEKEGGSIRNVAMPLVNTGDQRTSVEGMLEPLFEAAFRWMELGLEIDKLAIFVRSEDKAQQALKVFKELKSYYENNVMKGKKSYFYDLFISYSHQNCDVADKVVSKLKELKPDIKIFLDREELQTGVAWQQRIFEALDECRKVVTLFSPSYLASKVCIEEYNIALYRDRDAVESILFPMYINDATLPTYMKLTQYVDCREINYEQIGLACQQIVYEIEHKPTRRVRKDIQGSLGVTASDDHLNTECRICDKKIMRLERKIDQILEIVSPT